MIAVTISPDVSPQVYDILASCLERAIESAEGGVKAMEALDDPNRYAGYEQAAALLRAMQRQFQRQGQQE